MPCLWKKLKYHGFKKDTYGHWCSCKCQLKDPEFIKRRTDILDYKEIKKKSQETLIKRYGSKSYNNIDKIKETMLQRYGVEFYPSAKDYLKKSRETKLIKYGNEKYTNIEGICKTKLKKYGDKFYSNIEKARNTMLERYGSPYTLSSPILLEKVKKTKKERYGDENFSNKYKLKETMLKRYGVDCVFLIKNIRDRINYDNVAKTKKLKGTLNTSSEEKSLYCILNDLYGKENVLKEYQDKRYKNPKTGRKYFCDFYIKKYDLFIELNCHYSHGKHPFDKNNEDDILNLQKFKEKNKKSYDKIIEVWTGRDVNKRNIAYMNKLNYIEIFKIKFNNEEIKMFIENYMENKKENILV